RGAQLVEATVQVVADHGRDPDAGDPELPGGLDRGPPRAERVDAAGVADHLRATRGHMRERDPEVRGQVLGEPERLVLLAVLLEDGERELGQRLEAEVVDARVEQRGSGGHAVAVEALPARDSDGHRDTLPGYGAPVHVVARFADVVGRETVPLDEAALLVAAHDRPELDVAGELEQLDALAAGCAEPSLDGLRRHLFANLGFVGNTDDYYDPRNSFLDEVVTRRTGLPITLAVVTIEVGRRLGLALAGVGMPGHFLVRASGEPGTFLDPFA